MNHQHKHKVQTLPNLPVQCVETLFSIFTVKTFAGQALSKRLHVQWCMQTITWTKHTLVEHVHISVEHVHTLS